MIISDSQIAQLEEIKVKQFLDECAGYVREELGDEWIDLQTDDLPAFLKVCYDDGVEMGLTTKSQVLRFMMASLAYDSDVPEEVALFEQLCEDLPHPENTEQDKDDLLVAFLEAFSGDEE